MTDENSSYRGRNLGRKFLPSSPDPVDPNRVRNFVHPARDGTSFVIRAISEYGDYFVIQNSRTEEKFKWSVLSPVRKHTLRKFADRHKFEFGTEFIGCSIEYWLYNGRIEFEVRVDPDNPPKQMQEKWTEFKAKLLDIKPKDTDENV